MDIITVDFETFYSQDYSLTKLTTEAYVRDPRFEIIGVAIKVNDAPATWYSGVSYHDVFSRYDWANSAVLCHNANFDGAILSWKFGIRPKLWLDTMSMARPFHMLTCGVSLAALSIHYGLGYKGRAVHDAKGKRLADFTPQELKEYSEYCLNDNELTYKLFRKLSKRMPKQEIMVIDQTVRMFTEPVFEFDKDVLTQHLQEVQEKKAALIAKLTLPDPTQQDAKPILMSNDKFAEFLKNLGVEPPTKISKTTGKVAWAFSKSDKEFLALQEHDSVEVQAAVAARLGVKSTLEETRTESFLRIADRGRLPIPLGYWKAHTGRFAGEEKINMQNLPRGGNLRKSICAPPGKAVVTADASQIEARIIAWLAGQRDLLEAFRDYRDVYSEFATEVYGRLIVKTDKLERFVGKTCILGLGYGMGHIKFRHTLAIGQGGISVQIDEPESMRIVGIYRSKNHKIKSFWYRCGDALMQMTAGNSGRLIDHADIHYSPEGITLPSGLMINYPNLRSTGDQFVYDARKKPTKIYGGKMAENITQALAQDAIKQVMVRLRHEIPTALQVHDEIVAVVPESKAEWAVSRMNEAMTMPPSWAPDLPVACETGKGRSYGTAK